MFQLCLDPSLVLKLFLHADCSSEVVFPLLSFKGLENADLNGLMSRRRRGSKVSLGLAKIRVLLIKADAAHTHLFIKTLDLNVEVQCKEEISLN